MPKNKIEPDVLLRTAASIIDEPLRNTECRMDAIHAIITKEAMHIDRKTEKYIPCIISKSIPVVDIFRISVTSKKTPGIFEINNPHAMKLEALSRLNPMGISSTANRPFIFE